MVICDKCGNSLSRNSLARHKKKACKGWKSVHVEDLKETDESTESTIETQMRKSFSSLPKDESIVRNRVKPKLRHQLLTFTE